MTVMLGAAARQELGTCGRVCVWCASRMIGAMPQGTGARFEHDAMTCAQSPGGGGEVGWCSRRQNRATLVGSGTIKARPWLRYRHHANTRVHGMAEAVMRPRRPGALARPDRGSGGEVWHGPWVDPTFRLGSMCTHAGTRSSEATHDRATCDTPASQACKAVQRWGIGDGRLRGLHDGEDR